MSNNPYNDGFAEGRNAGLDKADSIYAAARAQENHLYDQMAVDAQHIENLNAENALLRQVETAARQLLTYFEPNIGAWQDSIDPSLTKLCKALVALAVFRQHRASA